MIYFILFITFFKIGAFTFGGGYAMLPLVEQEVIAHGWLSGEDILNFIAISESTPGPFAVNMSTYVGSQTAGIPGAICATLGVVLPSFIIILLIAKAYEKFQKNKYVNGAMIGLKGVVVGLIGAALISGIRQVYVPTGTYIFNTEMIIGIILFIIFFLALKKKINPIFVIILSGIIGIIVKPII